MFSVSECGAGNELYQKCAAIGSISDAQVQIASDKGAMPSYLVATAIHCHVKYIGSYGREAQVDAMLRGLLDAPINDVTVKCKQGNMMAKPDLTAIKSLYLIQRYGLERFKETQQKVQQLLNGMANVQINNDDVYINGFRIKSGYHFGEASGDTILERDVKTKFIQLLAIEEEAERENRVEDQTFCSVTMEIMNGQREVTVAKPNGQQNSVIFMDGNFNFNSNLGTNTGYNFNYISFGNAMNNFSNGLNEAMNHLNNNLNNNNRWWN